MIGKSPARGISKVADNISKERFLTKEETYRLLAALKQCRSPVGKCKSGDRHVDRIGPLLQELEKYATW